MLRGGVGNFPETTTNRPDQLTVHRPNHTDRPMDMKGHREVTQPINMYVYNIHVCMYVRMYVCTYVCMYVLYVCICMYVD